MFGTDGGTRTLRTQILSLIRIPIPSHPHMVLAVGIEPTSTALQTAAMTTSAKPAFGVSDEYRSRTSSFTD